VSSGLFDKDASAFNRIPMEELRKQSSG